MGLSGSWTLQTPDKEIAVSLSVIPAKNTITFNCLHQTVAV
jgi:hypothetical protein